MPSTPAVVRPPAPLPHRSAVSTIADYVMMILAIVIGGGSIVLFAWAGRPVLVPMGLTPGAALAWDALLSFIFFVQHSVMVRRPVRARLAAVIPPRYDGAFYAITSGVALTAFAVLFQPTGPQLFVLDGVSRSLVDAIALLAVAGFVWSVAVLRGVDLFGIGPIRKHLRASPAASSHARAFVVRGPYAFVRHPLYSLVIVLLWATPEMSASRLTVAALWTAWICVGALLEERDLIVEFGDVYRQYRRQVPCLFPWKGRVEVREDPEFRAAC